MLLTKVSNRVKELTFGGSITEITVEYDSQTGAFITESNSALSNTPSPIYSKKKTQARSKKETPKTSKKVKKSKSLAKKKKAKKS